MIEKLCITTQGNFVLVPLEELESRLGKNGDLDCMANPQLSFSIVAVRKNTAISKRATITQIIDMIKDGYKVK